MKTFKIITTAFACLLFSTNALSFEKRSELKIDYTKSDITCFGKINGKIDISISGGTLPYIIVWDNGLSSLSLENLRSGEYSVKVQDAKGKTAMEIIYITAPAPLSLIFNSQKGTPVEALNGSMNVEIKGGSPWEGDHSDIYFIRLNNQVNFSNPYEVTDGRYDISIEDSKGCKLKVPVNIDFVTEDANPFEVKTVNYDGIGQIQMTIFKPVGEISMFANLNN